MKNKQIQKIKEWLKNSTPQFKILISNKNGDIITVERISDNVAFAKNDFCGSGGDRIVGFDKDLIHVDMLVANSEESEESEYTDDFMSISLKLKKIEINSLLVKQPDKRMFHIIEEVQKRIIKINTK